MDCISLTLVLIVQAERGQTDGQNSQMQPKTLHPFNGLFSRTTWVSRYQQDKSQYIFKWGKRWWGFGMQWNKLTTCKQSAPRSRQITTPTPHLITQCLQAGCSSWCPTNSVKALKATENSVHILATPGSMGNKKQINCLYTYISVHWCQKILSIVQNNTAINIILNFSSLL